MDLPFRTLRQQIGGLREFSANPQQRIRLGWESIDTLIEGPARGEVCLVVGRSYTGKSLFASNVVVNNRHMPNIFFSLEMPEHQVLERMFGQWAQIASKDVQGMVGSGTLPQVLDTMPDAFPQTLIVDRPRLTLGDMSWYIEAFDEWYGERPAFVVVDYLEAVGGSEKVGDTGRTERIAKGLKDWAKDESVAVVVCHHANRSEPEWLPPTADSVRYAGYTEADFVLGIWRPATNPKLNDLELVGLRDRVYMNVTKNRVTGRTAPKLEFVLGPDLRFVDLSADEIVQRWG